MNLKKIIGNQAHWTLNKVLVKKLGLAESLLLQHFIDLQALFGNNEFYQQTERIEEELNLSNWTVKTSIKTLKDFEVISVTKKGMPCKNYYYVNHNKVIEILSNDDLQQDSENSTNKLENILVDENSTNKLVEIQPTSEEKFNQQDIQISTDKENNKQENKQEKELIKNTTVSNTGIIEKILEKCINTELEYKKWFEAIEDLNDFGIDVISEELNWDDDIKKNWIKKINNTTLIYNQSL